MRISDWSSDVCSSDLQRLDRRKIDINDIRVVCVGVGRLRIPVFAGRAPLEISPSYVVGLDVTSLASEIDHHVTEHKALVHGDVSDRWAGELYALISRGIFAVVLQDFQHDVLGGHPRTQFAVQVEAHDVRHARSEEPTSELQSLMSNSYAVFCLKKKKKKLTRHKNNDLHKRNNKYMNNEKTRSNKVIILIIQKY